MFIYLDHNYKKNRLFSFYSKKIQPDFNPLILPLELNKKKVNNYYILIPSYIELKLIKKFSWIN